MAPAENFEPEQEERRSTWRFPTSDTIGIDLLTGGRRLPAIVRDVSVRGMKLALQGSCPVGSPVLLEHPTAGTFRGVCIWTGEREIGVELLEPSRDIERVLQCICLLIGSPVSR